MNVPAPPRFSRAASFGIVVAADVVALVAGVAVAMEVDADQPLVTVAVADLVATSVVFGSSRLAGNCRCWPTGAPQPFLMCPRT